MTGNSHANSLNLAQVFPSLTFRQRLLPKPYSRQKLGANPVITKGKDKSGYPVSVWIISP